MTKIMLVEDDKSLREIYGVRLLAEGYDIVSAGDGEQALAVAIKERPALIVTDVMMPKISGFDMLDILRSTTETKNIKVIVMTALGSDEQRVRGEQLGADRYLVKSQVGIEDVVRTVHEVLQDQPSAAAPASPTNPQPVVRPPAPVARPAAVSNLPRPAAPAPASPAPALTPRPMAPPPTPTPTPTPPPVPSIAPPRPPAPTLPATPATPTSVIKNRVIQPLNNPNVSRVDINELLDKELAREAGIDLQNRPTIASTQQEKDLVQNQLQDFTPPAPAIPETPPPATTTLPPVEPTKPAPTSTQPVSQPTGPAATPAEPVNPAPTAPAAPATPATPPPSQPPAQQPPQPTIQIGSDGKVTMPDTTPAGPPPPPPVR